MTHSRRCTSRKNRGAWFVLEEGDWCTDHGLVYVSVNYTKCYTIIAKYKWAKSRYIVYTVYLLLAHPIIKYA